jgi:predicted RNase H-like nuclease/catechol 2,3-dioxygenase-like lactoylglutathione lyase family enzyme
LEECTLSQARSVTQFVGVDGCRGGWIAVILDDQGGAQAQVFESIVKLWTAFKPQPPKLILIDIPIGLPENGARGVDREARQVLGPRRSSIFAVPVRAAIYASAYAEGSTLNWNATGNRFSVQLWNIRPKIRDVDALLTTDAIAASVIKETHPEVIFWGLSGSPMAQPKNTEAGYEARISLLERYQPRSRELIQTTLERYPRSVLVRDDVVDALAAAVAAKLGNLQSIPAVPEVDSHGLPMQILYARRPGLVRLHHAQITIPPGPVAEEQARAFYCGLLGLKEIDKPEALRGRGGFWVELGDVQIHLGTEESDARRQTKSHLAYQVDDVDHWMTRLQEYGIVIDTSVPIPGYRRFEFRDPFGNRVEFIEPDASV